MPKIKTNQRKEVELEILEEIIASIRQIKYGEVVIVVHNSKIVQLEKREKRRFVHKEEVMDREAVRKKEGSSCL